MYFKQIFTVSLKSMYVKNACNDASIQGDLQKNSLSALYATLDLERGDCISNFVKRQIFLKDQEFALFQHCISL